MSERPGPEADCAFCDPARLPEHEVRHSPGGLAYRVFEPLDPVTPGHLLVVPVDHVADATEDPGVAAGAMFVAAGLAVQHDAANIITSIGTPATQSVFHLHVHVVPRREDDGLHLPWTDQHRSTGGGR